MIIGTWILVITLSLDMAGSTKPWARGIGALPIEVSVGGLPSQRVCMEGARALSAQSVAADGALKFRTARCVADVR